MKAILVAAILQKTPLEMASSEMQILGVLVPFSTSLRFSHSSHSP